MPFMEKALQLAALAGMSVCAIVYVAVCLFVVATGYVLTIVAWFLFTPVLAVARLLGFMAAKRT